MATVTLMPDNTQMAYPLGTLQPAAPKTVAVVPQTTVAAPVVVEAPYDSTRTIAIAALVLVIILIILAIIAAIVWFVNRRNITVNPGWTITNGVTAGTTDTWLPGGNSIYIARNPSSYALNISAPSMSLDGRIFIIDNTANTVSITVRPTPSSGITIVDNINAGVVAGRTSAEYIWINSVLINRIT